MLFERAVLSYHGCFIYPFAWTGVYKQASVREMMGNEILEEGRKEGKEGDRSEKRNK